MGKSIHLESIPHTGKDVRNVKVWGNLQGFAEQRILAGGTQHAYQRQSRREHHEVDRAHYSCGHSHCSGPESDYELHEDSVQVIYNNTNPQTDITFDEIENSQALGDLTLSNKVGKVITQRFKLVSGACDNLLPIGVYSQMFDKDDRDLKGTIDDRVKLIAANNKVIKQLGTVSLRVKVVDREKVCRFYVVPNTCRPILGLPNLKIMDLVQFEVSTTSQWPDYVSSIEPSTSNTIPSESTAICQGIVKDQVLSKYNKVFTGLGRLKVTPVKIHLKPGVKPQQKPCRRVPIAIRGKFKEELDSMEGQGTIKKLDKNTVTPWLNSFVNVGTDDGRLRVCLNPTGLNPYINRQVCNSYTLDEISYMLKDAKVMSVVDANKGFFQIPLDEESKLLTAMSTPYGVYIFNVLAMGLSLASDVFEITIRDITKDLKGVFNIADDI